MAETSFKKVRNISLAALLLAALGISCGNAKETKEVAKADDTKTEQAKPQTEEEMVKAGIEHLLHDVAQQKVEQFHWLTKDDILKMSGGKVEKYEQGDIREIIVNQPEAWKEEQAHALKSFKEVGDYVEFNFSDYTIEKLDIQSKKDEESKGVLCRCNVLLKSGGKLYDMEFKNMMLLDGEAKFLDGFDITPHKESAE